MVTELAEGVYWVGAVDWAIKNFHGHELSTHRGTSYNSYLIVDEKTVLVDTVWAPFREQFIENIREVIDPAKIDIVVANHAETDHSGSLPEVMRHVPNATVIVSQRGKESIEGHYHQPWNFNAVKTGDKINIGKQDLIFVEAPMLHWPDSMFTYLTGKNILMPNDAFGQHYAAPFRFNDQVNQEDRQQILCPVLPARRTGEQDLFRSHASLPVTDAVCWVHQRHVLGLLPNDRRFAFLEVDNTPQDGSSLGELHRRQRKAGRSIAV